ncbi:MAG: hypothetical protein ABR955_13390 [Verrucomicrobiota bacterium]|jgi:hypothetical protein
MKFGNVLVVAFLISLVSGASVAARAQSKEVMVHYMSWFQTTYYLAPFGNLSAEADRSEADCNKNWKNNA